MITEKDIQPIPHTAYEALKHLVEGLNRTHWSSWQTTAYFAKELAAAEAYLASLNRDD